MEFSNNELLMNDLYLKALKHKQVPISLLGFENLEFTGVNNKPVSSKSNKSTLKAVIPSDEQLNLLKRFNRDATNSKSQIFSTVSASQLNNVDEENSNNVEKGENMNNKKQMFRPLSATNSRYLSPMKRWIECYEREKNEVETKRKIKERKEKLGSNFDIVDKNGNEIVYDYRGFRIPKSSFVPLSDLKKVELDKQEKARLKQMSELKPFKGLIVSKTEKKVETIKLLQLEVFFYLFNYYAYYY
jgi:hypothetical protein